MKCICLFSSSLKKTAVVLKEHEEALEKKKDALIELGERERLFHV